MNNSQILYLLLCFVGILMMASLLYGPYKVQIPIGSEKSWAQWRETTDFYILSEIRLPRIILAAIVGAGLAISGAAIQGIFRNPLADPSLIGITNGAMLFAVLSIVVIAVRIPDQFPVARHFIVAFFSFIGSILTTYIVYFLSQRSGKTNVVTMLLAGIAISAMAAAVTGIFIYISDEDQLRDITFWTMGSLGGANWILTGITFPIVLLGIWRLHQLGTALNAILLGDHEAEFLGISVERIKTEVIIYSALLVGICIAACGVIGFVGLIIPHLFRILRGPDYRFLLLASTLGGAIFMVAADNLARTVIAPAELPIGILSGLIGGPFFLWILSRTHKNQWLI